MCRVIDAAKAKATQGRAGVPSDGERDAHELLRTLVRAIVSARCSGPDGPWVHSVSTKQPQLTIHPGVRAWYYSLVFNCRLARHLVLGYTCIL